MGQGLRTLEDIDGRRLSPDAPVHVPPGEQHAIVGLRWRDVREPDQGLTSAVAARARVDRASTRAGRHAPRRCKTSLMPSRGTGGARSRCRRSPSAWTRLYDRACTRSRLGPARPGATCSGRRGPVPGWARCDGEPAEALPSSDRRSAGPVRAPQPGAGLGRRRARQRQPARPARAPRDRGCPTRPWCSSAIAGLRESDQSKTWPCS